MTPRRFTDEQEAEIARIYLSGVSAKEIARRYNLPGKDSILGALKRQGVEQRPPSERNRLYKIDPTAFDVITPDAAYWWGFLYADGHVGREKTLQVALARRDRGHLEKLLIFLHSEFPIDDYISKNSFGNYPQSRIAPTERYLAKRLLSLGLSSPREFDKVMSNIPDSVIHHWIRGYFDGNGSVGEGNGRPTIKFCATEPVCEWMRDQFAKHAGRNAQQKIYKHCKSPVYYLEYSGRLQMIEVYNYMYQDATVWLDRKYEKFQKLMVAPESRQRDGKGRYL